MQNNPLLVALADSHINHVQCFGKTAATQRIYVLYMSEIFVVICILLWQIYHIVAFYASADTRFVIAKAEWWMWENRCGSSVIFGLIFKMRVQNPLIAYYILPRIYKTIENACFIEYTLWISVGKLVLDFIQWCVRAILCVD